MWVYDTYIYVSVMLKQSEACLRQMTEFGAFTKTQTQAANGPAKKLKSVVPGPKSHMPVDTKQVHVQKFKKEPAWVCRFVG